LKTIIVGNITVNVYKNLLKRGVLYEF